MSQAEPALQADRPILDGALSEEAFAAHIDSLRQGEGTAIDLLPLLSVSHPVYRGRSASAATKMRAYAVAALHDTGVPDDAVPFLVEILQTSSRPVLVAAAARAVTGMPKRDGRLANHLVRAIYNIWPNDQPVSIANYHPAWPLKTYATGLTEVLDALVWLKAGARHVIPDLETLLSDYPKQFSPRIRDAMGRSIDTLKATAAAPPKSCCGSAPMVEASFVPDKADLDLAGVELEDQSGQVLPWRDYFQGKPSVVAFFYAACSNPRKCVQTIYNLAEIQDRLTGARLEGQVRIAAITYDPERDTPAVLQQYGQSKGLHLGEDCRLMRVASGFGQVVKAFDLGVNYAGSQVNDHRIEVYLLNRDGRIAHQFLRLQADPPAVIVELARLLD